VAAVMTAPAADTASISRLENTAVTPFCKVDCPYMKVKEVVI